METENFGRFKEESSEFIRESNINPPEYGYWPNATLKLFITQACDLACPGCFNKSHLRTIVNPKLKDQVSNLTHDQIINAMDDARASFRTYAVEFSGGEPTLRPDLPDFISYGKKIGFSTRLTTNGTVFGAYGSYRDQLVKFLPKELSAISAKEMVDLYIQSGLDRLLISIDDMHTMEDGEFNPSSIISARAPVSVATNAIRLFLDRGFGLPRDAKDRNILDSHGIRVSMTASGENYEPSREIVEQVMIGVQAKPVLVEGEQLPKLWRTPDGQEIQLNRNETADIGYATNMKLPSFENDEDLFSRNCYDFIPRSVSSIGNGINQEIVVNYDGKVYNCAMQSYPLGDIANHTLSDIVEYVNLGKAPEEYLVGSSMFMEITKIAEETKGQAGWGEAYRRVLEMDPSLETEITQLRSHGGACYALGHNPKYLELLQQYRITH